MKIPKKVKIGAMTYKIERSPLPVLDNNICYGTHSQPEGIITITNSDEVCKAMKENSLIHELIHAINCNRDINLNEHQVDNLASGICEVFRNAKLNFRRKP